MEFEKLKIIIAEVCDVDEDKRHHTAEINHHFGVR